MTKFKIEPHMTASETLAQRTTLCVACGEEIAEDEECFWVMDEGVFHEGCLEFPEEGNKPGAIPVAKAGDSRTMTTSTTATKEQGLYGPGRKAKQLANSLPANEALALVRCDAGKTYSKEPHAGRRLARKGLVEKNAWKVTPLGAAVAEELCR